jgi:hypothetical protein
MGTLENPFFVVLGALAHAEVGQFDDAWRSIDEALTLIENGSRSGPSRGRLKIGCL